jgi:hypothetical protein
VKTSGALALVAGSVAKPTDCLYVMNVNNTTYGFPRISQKSVEGVVTGINRVIVPSATKPFFYEEGGNIKTLGVTAGNITARYIVVHQDMAPSLSSAGSGKYGTGITTAIYTLATRTLSAATMSAAFAAIDVSKRITFIGEVQVYWGRIASYVSATSVILSGDGLPPWNIGMGDIHAILVVDNDNDTADLKLNEYWHPEIVQRCVQMALADTKNTQLT